MGDRTGSGVCGRATTECTAVCAAGVGDGVVVAGVGDGVGMEYTWGVRGVYVHARARYCVLWQYAFIHVYVYRGILSFARHRSRLTTMVDDSKSNFSL